MKLSQKKKNALWLSILTISIAIAALPSTVKSQNETRLAIIPQNNVFYTYATPVNSTFVVNVTIYDVVDLYTWQINVTYDPALLNCTSASLPADNIFAGKTSFAPPPLLGPGWVLYGASLLGAPPGVDATEGRLAQLEFSITTAPSSGSNSSVLNFSKAGADDLAETFMQDSIGDYIDFTAEAGYYNYIYAEFLVHSIVFEAVTYNVTTLSNGTVSPVPMVFEKDDNRTAFNVTGVADTAGFVNITIPMDLMHNGAGWEVNVGGENLSYTKTENATHTSLYFTFNFTGSDQQTFVYATWVVPEFTPAALLVFLTTATLIAVVFANSTWIKKHRKHNVVRS